MNPSEDSKESEADTKEEESQSLFRGFASSVKNRGKSLWGNVKSLVEDQSSDSVITNIINLFFTSSGTNKEFENDSYIDTLLNRELDSLEEHQSVQNLIVYVAGGGSYFEYQRILELEKSLNKKIIYGCDYIYSPESFIEELKTIYKNE